VVPYSSAFEMENSLFAQLMVDVINKNKSFRFSAKGISMSPFIRDGDILTISPIRKRLIVGDVVAVLSGNNGFFIHRIIGTSRLGLLVKGDNRDDADGTFPREMICGVVSKIEHNLDLVRFGLGPEKVIIGLFSRGNILKPIIKMTYRIYHIPPRITI
jgi:phage repressor protein C with HTH and peptisase S24 domain